MKYFIYILECSNNTLYTGYTTDIERRYQEHLNGSIKCKYTRSFPPQRLAACWAVECKRSFVLKLEHKIKQLKKAQKHTLLASPEDIINYLPQIDDTSLTVDVCDVGDFI